MLDKAIVPLDGSAAVDVELPYAEEFVPVRPSGVIRD